MIISYEGADYEFDLEDIDIHQALRIEKHIGGPMLEFEQGIFKGRAACIQALGWLVLHGGNPDVPIASVNFRYLKLMKAFAAAVETRDQQAEAEGGPGPTGNGHAAASTVPSSAPASTPSGSATSAPGT